jgi:hypothetical protein
MKHILAHTFLFCLTATLSFAQLKVVPAYDIASDQRQFRTTAFVPDTLILPFFDDFAAYTNDSTYKIEPDTVKWFPSGGVFVNNRYPKNPPSFNVATFDGLTISGVPYNTVNSKAVGIADQLTSLPINLKLYNPADSLYISFYWQHAGVGEKPDTVDYLQLQFKDSTGLWVTQWTQNGNTAALTATQNGFQMVLIPVKDTVYFSKHFQFRFRSYGRLSGPFDVWNVDYIYLDSLRSYNDTFRPDWTIGSLQSTFLKNFSSMPYQHFYADSANQLNKNLKVTINAFYNGIQNYDVTGVLKNNYNTIIDTSLSPIYSNTASPFNFTLAWQPDFSNFANISEPQIVRHKIHIISGNSTDETSLYKFNNSYETQTVLYDYYAYDDGTAEYGIGSDQGGSKIALEYTPILPDTLKYVDICFTRNRGPNMNGRTITLSIWDNLSNTSTPLYEEAIQVKYANTINGFSRYYLSQPVFISDTFYIGYRQGFNDLLTMGYDTDTSDQNHTDKIFFNTNGSWQAYSSLTAIIYGNMMIRPGFSKGEVIGATFKKSSELEAFIYPNPTDGLINIKGAVKNIYCMDLTGKVIHEQSFDIFEEEKTINLSLLPEGMYILHLSNDKQTLVKKIIVGR